MNKKTQLFFFFLFSFLIVTSSTYAATVFGPQTLTINRWHYHYSYNTFTTDAAGKGQLVVSSTKLNNKIKNGFIVLNSKLISLKDFFRGDSDTLTREFKLQEKNRLFVFLRGKRNATITVEIKQGDIVYPPEANLNADPASIMLGESSTLKWTTSYANSVTINPGIGTVEPTGSVAVSPTKTTEYILTAKGTIGTAMAQSSVSISVIQAKPTVVITAEPDTIAPGASSTLFWNAEHADKCTIEPDIGEVATSGSKDITLDESTTYTIFAIGSGGNAKAKVFVQVYPAKVVEIDKSQAHYLTPDNTASASTSALRQHDLDWYYQAFTVDTAAQDKQMFLDAGIDLDEKYKLVSQDDVYIIEKIPYEDGVLLILEKRAHDIDGSRIRGWAGFVLENGLWKATYKFSEDEELQKYNNIIYANCIASYRFPPADFLEDSCWHNNDLTNYNQTGVALDKRYDEDLTTAVFNGVDTGLSLDQLNNMPVEQLSMGGWIKADNIDHNARIIEIGQDMDDSTAIVIDAGNGLRYWVHVGGRRIEGTAAMDYDFHDNQWHHVFLTYDGIAMKLHVDGQLKDSLPAEGSIDSAPILNIGQRNAAINNGSANTFKGRLDDIQIYNKALTTDEILKKYENGTTQSL